MELEHTKGVAFVPESNQMLLDPPRAISDRLARLPRMARSFVLTYFSARRKLFSWRHRGRVTLAEDVMLRGRLVVKGRTRVELGRFVRVRGTVIVGGGGQLTVGANSLLNGCWINASDRVTLGDECLISDCGITDSDFHNLDPETRHDAPSGGVTRPVTLDENVWVGAHALVLKGTHIARDSVVGAGSVVRGEVPARVVVAGNPAVVVKRL